MLEALRPLDTLIGTWKGTGTSLKSSGWDETIECTWGFREEDGRVSINFYIAGGELLEVGLLSYDPRSQLYKFVGRDKKGSRLHFEGKLAGTQTLRLPRTDKDAKDGRDLTRRRDSLRGQLLDMGPESFLVATRVAGNNHPSGNKIDISAARL